MGEVVRGEDVDAVDAGAYWDELCRAAVFSGDERVAAGGGERIGGSAAIGVGGAGDGDA